MKRKLISGILVGMMAFALALSGCGQKAAEEPAPPAEPAGSSAAAEEPAAQGGADALADWDGITLTVVTNYGPTHRGLEIVKHWMEQVVEKTGGKITFDLYPGEELVKNAEMYGALTEGICDVLFQDPSYNPEAFPLIKGFGLPGLKMDNSKVSTRVANDFWHYGEEQGWEETQNIKYLFSIGLAPSGFESNKKIEKVEDFAGMQIRANGFAVDPVQALGAAPVALTAPEVYEGLLKGTVEASLMPYDALINWKLAEVAKYAVWAPVISNINHYGIMNKATWEKLPPAAQDIITGINAECIEFAAPLFDQMGEDGLVFAEEQGMEIYSLDDATLAAMGEKMAPVVDKWLGDCESKGLPGEDALAKLKELCEKYNAEYGG